MYKRQAYLLEADLLLSNPSLITKYQYTSNYLGVPVAMTDDWCFQCRKDVYKRQVRNGIVAGYACQKISNGWERARITARGVPVKGKA